MVVWHKLAGFLVIGYLTMTRSFAYLGFPPLKIFIGEIVLAGFLTLKPRVALGTWSTALLRSSPLNGIGLALLMFIGYGVWQVARGVFGGSGLTLPLKHFVFNYYPLYLFFGMWVGLHSPQFLPRLVQILAFVNGVYGLLFVSVLKYLNIAVPGAPVGLFGLPGGSAVAIVGLLCLQRNLAAIWPLLALNSLVILAVQVRAEWLALCVGLLLWGLLTGRLGRVIAIGFTGLAVIGLIEFVDIKIGGRVNSVSLGGVLSHVIAPIDKDLAEQFGGAAGASAGSVKWRQQWWEQIWSSAHSDSMFAAFGHGYGFHLLSLAPAAVRLGQAEEIRTPHNVFYYALGYTGWVGVALFGLLQFAIFRLLWLTYRVSGAIVGVAWWAMGTSMGFFGNFFESPFGAIPFYLLIGMSMAPALQGEGR